MTYDFAKIYKKEVVPQMKSAAKAGNVFAVPKIEKVVVNTGIGSVKDDAQKEFIEKALSIITGQKPSKRLAKKSIASFKLRMGGHIGYSVTLRGKKMYDFLNKLVFVAIPRKRDFRGLNEKGIDEMGNMTIGFKEHLVFPEMAGGDIKNLFGFQVTIVTTAKNKKEALQFFKAMGFPFSKK
jgi:large subunit ribosomal protein L5